jgi:hypothetical protein
LEIARLDPLTWQVEQVRGVPWKTPFLWHASHGVLACTPVKGNPVFTWSKLRTAFWPMAAEKPSISTNAKSHFKK